MSDEDFGSAKKAVCFLYSDVDEVVTAIAMYGPLSVHFDRISETGHKNEAMVKGHGFRIIDPDVITILSEETVATLNYVINELLGAARSDHPLNPNLLPDMAQRLGALIGEG